ncbi:MAG TPA: hypothetical protein VFT12_04435 [Thermoanaerobaculia bacterium]|nr:hypothetical protein [Thermoanaerobaculia bacterium]
MAFSSDATTTTRRPLIVTSQDHSQTEAANCEHFHTRTFTSLPASAASEEKRNIQLNGARQLKVITGSEGGVSINGWDRPYARLTVCKSAMALTDAAARKTLSNVSVSVSGQDIIARGPAMNETQTWWVNMILWVPRTARLDVTAANGGIAIRNMAGQVTARATNGGISIAGCDGDHHLETKNGGISIDKVSGRLSAVTERGPISLKLRDLAMPTLEAITDSGGEIYCNVKGCSDGLGAWADDRKKLRIGGQTAPSIRLTSYSADIMIEQVR